MAGLVVVAVFALTYSAHTQGNQPSYLSFQSALSAGGQNWCIDIPGGKYQPGTNVTLSTCTSQANQTFNTEGGTLTAGGLCLDAQGEGAQSAVTMSECNGGNSQAWQILEFQNGQQYQAIANGESMCITVGYGAAREGAPLTLEYCQEADAQGWVRGPTPAPQAIAGQPTPRVVYNNTYAAEPTYYWRNGRRYCWYDNGWNGAGWYVCGEASTRGSGYGGPIWWNNWWAPGQTFVGGGGGGGRGTFSSTRGTRGTRGTAGTTTTTTTSGNTTTIVATKGNTQNTKGNTSGNTIGNTKGTTTVATAANTKGNSNTTIGNTKGNTQNTKGTVSTTTQNTTTKGNTQNTTTQGNTKGNTTIGNTKGNSSTTTKGNTQQGNTVGNTKGNTPTTTTKGNTQQGNTKGNTTTKGNTQQGNTLANTQNTQGNQKNKQLQQKKNVQQQGGMGGMSNFQGGMGGMSNVQGGMGGMSNVQRSQGRSGQRQNTNRRPQSSDIQLKHDVVRIGTVAEGIGLYRFQYNWSDQVYVGVVAQEVEAVRPDAVMRDSDGYLRVYYDRIGAPFDTWQHWQASGGQGAGR